MSKDEDIAKGTANLVGCLVLLVLWIPLIILDGWVFSILWGWVMVPTFGLAALSVSTCIALRALLSWIKDHHNSDEFGEGSNIKWDKIFTNLIRGVFLDLYTLALVYIVMFLI